MDKILAKEEVVNSEEKNKNEEKNPDITDITKIIGINLKRARIERSFSLDDVSLLSKVSKSMLSDIERGRKCPTVAVLYRICEGIHVSFPAMLKAPEKVVDIVKNKEPVLIYNGIEVYCLFGYDIQTSLEIYMMKYAPNTEMPVDSHGPKILEYIMIIEGTLTITIDDETYELHKGEAIKFLADRKHTYANKTDKVLLFYTMIYYGT